MRSTASFQGHPIHPMLVVYPFAFLTGAFWFNLAASASRRRDLADVSDHLIPAGVAAGLLAAIPGIIDYQQTVPPRSSGKNRATRHALLNVGALGLFTASWLLDRRRRRGGGMRLLMQGAGTAMMSVAGYLGGTLVYRNQIGVDHRYANAGTWREDRRTNAGATALAASGSGLKVDQMKLVHVDDKRIVVARTERDVTAFDDRCTHKGGPLSDGVLICGTVQCPWHGSQFDVHTGAVKCGPAADSIAVYPVE